MKCAVVLFALALATLTTRSASAFSRNVSQVPNGYRYSCNLCHPTNRAEFTLFGVETDETKQGRDVVWAAFYDSDPDCDGFTNGDELGDPSGAWRPGDPQPDFATSDPNDPASHPSSGGNGPCAVPVDPIDPARPGPGEEPDEGGAAMRGSAAGLSDAPPDDLGVAGCAALRAGESLAAMLVWFVIQSRAQRRCA
jgi:hypothetical protein